MIIELKNGYKYDDEKCRLYDKHGREATVFISQVNIKDIELFIEGYERGYKNGFARGSDDAIYRMEWDGLE